MTTKRIASIFAVSIYLILVGCVLVLAGRIHISLRAFARRVIASLRPPFKNDLKEFTHEKGNCHVAPLGRNLVSDSNGRSRLTLFENGRALPHPHSSHDDIREIGAGRYSHWGDALYFSSSDNSDPSKNGRRYSVQDT